MQKEWFKEGQFFSVLYIRGDKSVQGFTLKPKILGQRTKREVEGSIKLANIFPPAKILDVPCGYGRHSIEFAKRGFDVTGRDINSFYLNIAETNAKNIGLDIDFGFGDMRKLENERSNYFDLVSNLSLSFGFFEDERENTDTMKQFFRVLKKGGKLIIHTDIAPEMAKEMYRTHEMRDVLPTKIGNKKYDSAKLEIKERIEGNRLFGTWTIIERNGTKKTTPEYSLRIYSADEFIELCEKVGFTKVEIIGDWKEEFNPKKHQEMIVVATK